MRESAESGSSSEQHSAQQGLGIEARWETTPASPHSGQLQTPAGTPTVTKRKNSTTAEAILGLIRYRQ